MKAAGRSRNRKLIAIVTPLSLLAVAGVLLAPATTKQGFNFVVSTHQVPAYVKALDFVSRDRHYALLAKEITGSLRSDREKALAVFGWTREHIHPTPAGWPVTDDHIWHIIVRGHGVQDQVADVFTTLLTYAGVPAFWQSRRLSEQSNGVILSFAKVDGRWAVFDVWHGLVFTTASGELASREALAADPQRVTELANGLRPGGVAYVRYFTEAPPPTVPRPLLRAELQMPWRRLQYEAGRVLGVVRGPHET